MYLVTSYCNSGCPSGNCRDIHRANLFFIFGSVSCPLASGCISNLFIVKDGQLLTPIARGEEADNALPAPVLPGITRAAVIELAC